MVSITVAGFCAASLVVLDAMRRDTLDRAVDSGRNLANALALDIARNVELYDLSLSAVVDGLAEPGFDALTSRLQDLLLYDRAATASNLGSILILDRNGIVMRASTPGLTGHNLSNHEYFQALRSDPHPGLFISKPFRHELAGDEEVIALARALRTADGAFAGVVVGTLHLAYIETLFATANLGAKGNSSLLMLDGTVVARVPDGSGLIGRNLAASSNFHRFLSSTAGIFEGISTVDGAKRIYSYKRVGNLPLVLVVALSTHDVLAPWRVKAGIIGLALLTLCGIAVSLARLRARSQTEHRLLADNAIDLIIRLDVKLRRTYVSPSCTVLLGYMPAELLGGTPREIVHEGDWPGVAAWIAQAAKGRTIGTAVFRMRHKDGTYIWIEGRCRAVSDDRGFLVVLRDVSERVAAEDRAAALTAELAELANSDGLTGLANRRRFDQILTKRWSEAAMDGASISLLLLDVDRFKDFNDRYGHQHGDACLRRIADAVRVTVKRPNALVARYGGEELAVVLPAIDATCAMTEAEHVRLAVEGLDIAHAGSPERRVTLSIGCATVVPEAGSELRSLVAIADANLYQAKRNGRNVVVGSTQAALRSVSGAAELGLQGFDARTPEGFDTICRIATQVLDASAAVVLIGGPEAASIAGHHGEAMHGVSDWDRFRALLLESGTSADVLDTAARHVLLDDDSTASGQQLYAAVALRHPANGRELGWLCIVHGRPRASLDQGQCETLRGLARLAIDDLLRSRSMPPSDVPPFSDVA